MTAVRIALLGCGGIQGKHLRTFLQRDDAEVVALCDVADPQIQKFVDRWDLGAKAPGLPRYTDPAEMYAEVKPDAVSVCTPHTQHYEQAVAALDAGCHVLMEKPMVTAAEHAYLLDEKVKATGKVFLVGYNTPCSPEMNYLRELIRTEALGKLELISGHLSQGWMKGTAGSWRQDPALSGGGQAYDSGAHPLSSLCFTVDSRVAEVFAFVDNHGTPVDINSAINIRFENGAFAALAISGNCPTNGAHMAYMFEDGKVEFDPWAAAWINIYKGDQRVKYPPITGEPTQPADNLLDAIRGKAEVFAGTQMGIIHSELMDAIYESQRTGQVARPKSR